MTLKNSYSSYASYFFNSLKRKSWNLALPSLLFFITMTLPALMIMGANDNNVYTKYRFEKICNNLTMLMDDGGIFVKIAFVFLAIVSGISAFSYLHNKSKVDFYHSFPISRQALFFCNIATSIIPIVVGFLINFIATNVLIASFGYGIALKDIGILYAIFENLIYFTAIFSVVSLCTILCGNTVISLILTFIALLGQIILPFLMTGISGYLYVAHYYDYNELIEFALKLSPLSYIFATNVDTLELRLIMFIVYIVAIVIIIAISLLCFVRRKSERSGVAIAFNWFKFPLKLYFCIILALGFAVLFRTTVGHNIWIYFGVIFGIFIAHCFSEITFEFSFKSIFKNWQHGLVFVALFCIFIGGMQLDVTGYNTRTVNANSIKSFSFNSYENDVVVGNDYWQKKKGELKDEKSIAAIAQLIKEGAKYVKENDYNLDILSLNTANAELYSSSNIINGKKYKARPITFSVSVKQSMFRSFKRQYVIANTKENIDLFNTIRYSQEYKQKFSDLFYEKVMNDDKNSITQMKIQNRTENLPLTSISKDKALLVMDAMREDYLNMTAEEGYNTPPVFLAEVDCAYYYEEKSETEDIRKFEYAIYPSYTKTLALLKEYGITPTDLNPQDVSRIAVEKEMLKAFIDYGYNAINAKARAEYDTVKTNDESSDYYVNYSDLESITKILKVAYPSKLYTKIDTFGIYSGELIANAYLKNDGEPLNLYADWEIFKELLDITKV